MTDFASLGIRIDSSQAKGAAGDLDRLTAAGARAEAATLGLGKGSKAAAIEASAMATAAQSAARAAVGQSAGFGAVTSAVHGNTIAMRETLVVSRELLSGNLTRLPGSLSILAQQFAISGQAASGFAATILKSFGIIKTTTDAGLAAEAAAASASADAIRSVAARAAANVTAADTEIALAQAQIKTAETTAALTAAQARLALAHEAVAAAAAEATVAEVALADAMAAEATASAAASAKTVTSLGRVGVAAVGAAVAAGVLFVGFKALQAQVRSTGELDKFANSLGLSKKEMKELRQEVGGLSSKEMQDLDNRARAFEVTWGDVFNGLAKTASDALGLEEAWDRFKSGARNAFVAVLKDAVAIAASIRAVFVAAFNGLNPENAGKSFTERWKDAQKDGQKEILANLKTVEDNIIGASKKRIRDAANTIIEDRTPKKTKKQSDHGLADALAELDAQIKGQNALAAAYQVSDAAAIKAEAQQKAEEQAIRHKGEVGIFYEKELALAVAKRAADGAKTINQLSGQTAAQKAANDAIADGSLSTARAAQQLQIEAEVRPLVAAAAVAEGKAKAELEKIIARVRIEQAKSNDEVNRGQVLAATEDENKQLDKLKLEASLIGATNVERAKSLALLEAEQFLKDHPFGTANDGDALAEGHRQAVEYVKAVAAVAEGTANLQTAQDNYNNSLSYTADLLGLINDQAQTTANSLSEAFGSVGDGIGQALTALTGYAAAQATLDQNRKEALKAAGSDAAAAAKVEILYSKQSAIAKQQAIMSAIGGLKSLFKEHSAGYKIMSAIEKAYAAFQAVETVLSIARELTKTATTVTQAGIRTTANTAEGASKMFAELGPWGFAAVAAMMVIMTALGAKGGGGGGGSAPPTSAEDLQAAAGTGTVLGDNKAQSESIKNSLALVAANTNKDLEYSNAMLMALRNIDTSIAKMAGTVARQIQVSGSLFDTSKLNLGDTGSSGFLGLFSSSTKKSLYDLGINLVSASVATIIGSGVSGNSYQIVQKIKTSSGFLGIGGGTKTSYTTTTGALDPEISTAIQNVILSLRDGLVAASKVIGLDGAQAILDSFQVSLGKISFKDLTGKEIEDQLNAVFSNIGDQMAEKLLPTLKSMQLVGEGLFETFIRVAKEYEAVDIELKSIGRSFGAVGVGSIEARDALVQLFGGLDEFISSTDSFREKFLTDAEQIAPVQASVIAELQRLGLAGITTRDQFKQAVLGLDLTTDAGRQMYAALLAVAPAFDKVLSYFEQLNTKAAQALQSTIDQFSKFVDSLTKYRDSLFATDAAQGNAYAALKARFSATAALASTGDATALGGLEQSGKDFLTAAKNHASSLQDYYRDVALVARGVDKGIFAAESTADYAQLQLDALKNQATILGTIAANTQATATALNGGVPVPTPAGSTATTANGAPAASSEDIAVLRSDVNAALQAIAISTASLDKTLKRFDRGDSLAITIDSDDPLPVNLTSWG